MVGRCSGDAVVEQFDGREMQGSGDAVVGQCNGRAMQWSGNQSVNVIVEKVNRLGNGNLGKGKSGRGRGAIDRYM
jgi:hypothetical protein